MCGGVDVGGHTVGHPDLGTLVWHSDLSFQRRPALSTILYGIEVPKAGGETLFADLASAYDALGAATRRRIAGSCARFTISTIRASGPARRR